MTKNWIAINAVLLLVSGGLGWRLYTTALSFRQQNNVARIQPAKDPKQRPALEPGLQPLKAAPPYNVADYSAVPAQNVFSDTRTKDEPPPVAAAVQEAPPLTVRPVLVGVVVAGEQKMASVVEPNSGSASRRSQTRRLGDTYQGYTITDITRDQMVLERGNRREVIPLFDAAKHPQQGTAAQSGKTPVIPTRIVAVGGGGAGAGQAAVASGVRPVAPPGSAAGAPAPAAAQGRSATQAQQTRQTTPASQQPGTQQDAQPARRVIRTPFGDVQVRPDP